MASWLRAQRKSELLDLADFVGLSHHESLNKRDLETLLDEYLVDNMSSFITEPRLTGFFASRARANGSPVKKDPLQPSTATAPFQSLRRRAAKLSVSELPSAPSESDNDSAVAHTPTSHLPVSSSVPLPVTPADVANAIDRSTVAMCRRISLLYRDSGITHVAHATRESLSTVPAVLFLVAVFELWYLRKEILGNRYAFTIPALPTLGTPDVPVHVPDMFLLLTSSFWRPALLWTATSFVIPALAGYFFNLSFASATARRRYSRAASPSDATTPVPTASDYVVDPLVFSIAKALVSYIVYAQVPSVSSDAGSLYGLVDPVSVVRINNAVYGGWKGLLIGCSITALISVYDAVLRR